MAHIKRAKVAEEAKREAENPMKGKCFDQPFPNVNAIITNIRLKSVTALTFSFLVSSNEKEELVDLRERCKKLERQNANLQKEVDQLLKFKKNCLQHHHKIKTEKNDVPKSEPNNPFSDDGTIVLL